MGVAVAVVTRGDHAANFNLPPHFALVLHGPFRRILGLLGDRLEVCRLCIGKNRDNRCKAVVPGARYIVSELVHAGSV